MAYQLVNNASSYLASAYTAGDTTITLHAGDGALFPATGDFILAIGDPVAFYLKCTSRSGDVLTVATTGQEGTVAANKGIGVAVNHVLTAGVLAALIAAVASQPEYLSSLVTGPDTSKTISGATHGFTSIGRRVCVFDNSSPRNPIDVGWTVSAVNYDVVITFAVAQSDYYVSIR